MDDDLISETSDRWQRSSSSRTPRAAGGARPPVISDDDLDRWNGRTRVANLHKVAHEAVMILEADGSFRFADPEARWMLGYTTRELAEITTGDLLHPDDREIAAEAFLAAMDNPAEKVRCEFRIRRPDGSMRWYDITFQDLRNDPRIGGIAAHAHDVTERHEAEDALREREERYRLLVQHSFDALVVCDENNVILYATPSIEQMFGWPVAEVTGQNGFQFVHPDDLRSAIERGLAALANPGNKILAEFRLRHADGSYRWVESSVVNLFDHPSVGGYVQSFRDVTDRRLAEEQIRASEQRLLSLVENAGGAILVLGAGGELQWQSPGAEALWGLSPGELTKFGLLRASHPADRRDMAERFRKLVDSPPRTTIRLEARMHHADGSMRWYEAVYTNCLDDASVQGVVINVRDTTDRAIAEQSLRDSELRLEYQAMHDPLTEMPNRTLLFDRMQTALSRARAGGTGVAVLFCDLDNFKFVNDCHGHSLGDELLCAVARRLAGSVPAGDTVARFGGDEFVIVAEGIRAEAEAWQLAEQVTDRLRESFATSRGELFVTGSIGIAFSPDGTGRPEELIRDADSAMYAAKSRGRARIETFDAGMRARAVEWHETERALRGALERHELRVHFQPVVDLATRSIVGVEALVRWQHPELGLLAPDRFIAVAEQTGLVIPLGQWVMQRSCELLAGWHHTVPGCADLWVAVNLSTRQLADEHLPDEIAAVLARTGIEPRYVHVEITETELMRDIEHSTEVLHRLKALGINVAIDDFGTGYSSFSYLRTLPVDALKIDRSFISDLDLRMYEAILPGGNGARGSTSNDHVALVEALVNFGHILHLEVVAEGVETMAQARLLGSLGCDLAQGYQFARPMAPDALVELLGAGLAV